MSILVAALDGVDRFEQMGDLLGIARNILSDRLAKLVALGLLERVAYSQRPLRYRYVPTSRGRAFETVLKAAVAWSDEAYADT
jgi:DNA-binding HxlR family transcriptional regulator